MYPAGYWTKTYWTGRYWPPTGIVVRLPEQVPLESIISDPSLIAVISLTDQLGAIISRAGIIGARLEVSEAEATWLAEEAPPSAMLVRGDLSVILGQDALAVGMPVLYVSSEIVADLLESTLEDGAIISVVSRSD
jgi:hypothetical protein